MSERTLTLTYLSTVIKISSIKVNKVANCIKFYTFFFYTTSNDGDFNTILIFQEPIVLKLQQRSSLNIIGLILLNILLLRNLSFKKNNNTLVI